MNFAKQLEKLGTETAFAVAAMAAEHRAGGGRVFPFHLGDINIPPPDSMTQGVARAIADGKNGYCPGAGIPVFREQLARVISQTRGVEYAAENIAAQPGGKPVIAKFLQLTMNPGDEVLYPVPGFPIYESQIRYQGGVPVPYHYRPSADGGGFELDLDELRNAVSAKTRALIFNNHHNPTGASASDAELDAVAEIAVKHDLRVMADEAYFTIRHDGDAGRTIVSRPGMRERTVILFTCSKQFAMTGWRLGAAIGPADAIKIIANLNTNMESCTTHFVQQAVGEGLRDGADGADILAELTRRRDALAAGLNKIDGVSVSPPPSAFYIHCDAGEIVRRKGMKNADELMRATLRETGVSFCTGEHFGEPKTTNFIRFAFSGISPADIEEGCAGLKAYFEREI